MSSSPPPFPPQPPVPPVPPVPPTQPPGPPYGAPAPGAAASGRNGFGLAALIVGIVALVGAVIPLVNYGVWFLALVGVVLGIVGLVLKARKRGAAISGLVLSVVALVLSIVLAVVYTIVFFAHAVNNSGIPPLDGTPVPLVYQVDGTGSDVNISYSAYDSGYSVTQQASGQSLPFEKHYSVSLGGANTYNSYTITAVNGAAGGDVTCRILLDGRVLIEQTSTGAYATASCTASAAQLLG